MGPISAYPRGVEQLFDLSVLQSQLRFQIQTANRTKGPCICDLLLGYVGCATLVMT